MLAADSIRPLPQALMSCAMCLAGCTVETRFKLVMLTSASKSVSRKSPLTPTPALIAIASTGCPGLNRFVNGMDAGKLS